MRRGFGKPTGPLPVERAHKVIQHANGMLTVYEFSLEDRNTRELVELCRWARDNKSACVREYGFAFSELVSALKKQMAKRAAAKECTLTPMQKINGRREAADYSVSRRDWWDKYQRGNLQSWRMR